MNGCDCGRFTNGQRVICPKHSRGQPLTCTICGGMYTNTTRTVIQRERAYALHQATDRHHNAVKALLEADDGAGWTALGMAFAKSPGPRDVLNDH